MIATAAASEQTPATVVVTGAAGAIGAATARAFLDAGFRVVGLDQVAIGATVTGQRYEHHVVDVRDEGAVAAVMAEAAGAGPLRHLVGVAGGALPEEPPTQDDVRLLPSEIFRASVELNLVSQFTVLHAASEWLLASGPEDRSVTFTSSFNALSGQGMPAYSAAKAGLVGMMHALTGPLGAEGVRVNVVAPGTIRTPRTERLWRDKAAHFQRLEASTALGRLGAPEDVADTYLAVATRLRHVTGQVLVVDGGQMTKRR